MKQITLLLCLLLMGTLTVNAQNKKLTKAYDKMAKVKLKEYKKEGWKLSASSLTLEVALLQHYEQLKDKNNQELVGEVSSCKSINICRQAAYNNAIIAYANLAGSTLRGRIASDMNVDQSSSDGQEEFDKMYAAYERLVEVEIKGILIESYCIVHENKGLKSFRAIFLVNEEKAKSARIRALERAAEESAAAQKYANKISEFVHEGFEIK